TLSGFKPTSRGPSARNCSAGIAIASLDSLEQRPYSDNAGGECKPIGPCLTGFVPAPDSTRSSGGRTYGEQKPPRSSRDLRNQRGGGIRTQKPGNSAEFERPSHDSGPRGSKPTPADE